MAIPHAQPGELIDVRPLQNALGSTKTRTLAKTEYAEIIRLILPRGKELATHRAPGQLVVQCLEGRVIFTAMEKQLDMTPGSLLYLPANEPHSVRAEEDSSLLLTILFPRE